MRSHDLSLLQLRYNMRAFPVAMVGVGWVLWLLRDRIRLRFAVWAVAALALAVTIPVLWSTMKTYPYQFNESAFVAAVETGEDQAGTKSVGGYDVGMLDALEMANFINGRVDEESSIFTDDESVTQEVMLLGGRPDLFFDRIDRGDEKWRPVLADPWGEVDYILLSKGRFAPDQIQDCYPSALDGEMPGTETLLENDEFILLAVDSERPRNAPEEFPVRLLTEPLMNQVSGPGGRPRSARASGAGGSNAVARRRLTTVLNRRARPSARMRAGAVTRCRERLATVIEARLVSVLASSRSAAPPGLLWSFTSTVGST